MNIEGRLKKAAIVGFYTRKVLFIGVKNKYCCICARAASKNETVSDHHCFKNWDGSSSAIEGSIIADGFLRSMEMHGAKYARMIGDGDVYFKVLDCRPYDTITVEKIECKNHLLRNMCSKRIQLSKDSKMKYVHLRKLLGSNVMRLRKAVACATKYWLTSNKTETEKINELRKDILNAVNHVFGEHDICKSYFCNKQNSKSSIAELKQSGIFYKIMEILNYIADHSKSLLYNVNTNCVEQFNSIISKFISGKRINFCSRGSYQARCHAAVISYNSKKTVSKIHKSLCGNSPGKYSKIHEQKVIRKNNLLKKRRENLTRKKVQTEKSNQYYGTEAKKPDMTNEIFEEKKEEFLKNLYLNEDKRILLEKNTQAQRDSGLWMHERSIRLTASNFARVCKKRPETSCQGTVEEILYSHHIDTAAMRYGRLNENTAREQLIQMGMKIQSCGLFIDKVYPFLGASPDGLLEDDGVVEIKCPFSCRELTPDQGILLRKFDFWRVSKDKKEIEGVNKKHKFYYQVQGQLHITERSYCLFVLWTPKGIKMVKLLKDDEFWKKNMVQKLKSFFFECLLPQLIDPRHTRSINIREPQSILDAQKEKTTKKRKIAQI